MEEPDCFMERGSARKCSLDNLIVSSSPSLVQELYQDDELLLITPHALLDHVDQEIFYGKKFYSGLLPRRSRLCEPISPREGNHVEPSFYDEIFRSPGSDASLRSFNSDSYVYDTPKKDGVTLLSPPRIYRCNDENLGISVTHCNSKLLIPSLE